MPEFAWDRADAQCPDRGAGLTHMQDTKVGFPGLCCFCSIRILFPAELPVEEPKLIGLPIDLALEPGCALDHNALRHGAECVLCHIAHEARAITDLGPQGTKNGIGRGVLTERQAMRILHYVEYAAQYGKELT